jgi:hypothetical protein
MKKRIHIFKKITYVVMATLVFAACQNLDLPPLGAYDTDPSVVKINYPLEGAAIKVFEDPASIDIEIEIHDDHVVSEISVSLNGTEIANLSSFSNPRNIIETITYDGLVNGEYVLSVTSTDIDGTSTTAEVNFTKEPPYTPTFDGEILYMPFDGDYRDQVNGSLATQVGTPGFSGSGYASANAYKGTPSSYITMPTEGLLNPEFSAVFWIKTNPIPDRAGILTISPMDTSNPTNQNNRSSGCRLFRENVGGNQVLKLNIGSSGDNWFDGGVTAALPLGQWAHVAISIGAAEAAVYINGQLVSGHGFPGLDWTGCDLLSIGSGAPRFVEWGHLSEESPIDELRIFNKALSEGEVQDMAGSAIPYIPQYPGETFYMPFEGNYVNLLGNMAATQVGSPQITTDAHEGSGAYAGATDAYLTYPSVGLTTSEFSASMWYKLDASPDRAGILVAGPEDTANGSFPDIQNLRTHGFRFFRESGAAGFQRFKLNVGQGTGDAWVDGGVAADVPIDAGWVHLAFTISATKAIVFINGAVVKETDITGVDWTGCDVISIMSGVPRFTEWGHLSDNSYLDDLRFFNKALSTGEVGAIYGGEVYFGSTLYIPFEGNNVDIISGSNATGVGTPGFAGEAAVGSDAYAGATDSYLTYPTADLTSNTFSAAMWYKLDATPDRAGILVAGPEDTANGGYPDIQNLRTHGFRFFRESGAAGFQRFKLNVGQGTGDAWVDGGVAADVPIDAGWVHLAFTISPTKAIVYINGTSVKETDITGIDWTGCDILSIMSGVPRFTEWGHKSDLSYLDDLYLFDKTLTQAEIQAIMSQ